MADWDDISPGHEVFDEIALYAVWREGGLADVLEDDKLIRFALTLSPDALRRHGLEMHARLGRSGKPSSPPATIGPLVLARIVEQARTIPRKPGHTDVQHINRLFDLAEEKRPSRRQLRYVLEGKQ